MPEPNDTDHHQADSHLIRAALLDRQAFSSLYERYVGRIYGYCLRRLGDTTLAEAASQIFIQAIAGLQRCDPERFRPCLFSIARNVSTDTFRRRPDTPLADAGALTDPQLGPEATALRVESEDDGGKLVATLTHDQRQVVELRLAGFRGAEIAAAIGRSHAAVKML